jgi:hypothetical protein
MNRLVRLPQGWLHIGRLCDVPLTACYKDHCGDTWVWVMPDGIEGLAGFTLVLQDIATLNVTPSDGSVPPNITPPLLVTLWVVQNTLDPIVFIDVGDKPPAPVDVTVGQAVVWRNQTGQTLKVASLKKSDSKAVFDTGDVPGGTNSKLMKFDDTLYAAASGPAGVKNGMVKLDYTVAITGRPEIKSTITLKAAMPVYSPTLVFRVDRVIRPEFANQIEALISKGIQDHETGQVAITWQQWMDWTTPYQGQRTGVKPGAATTAPAILPPTRAVAPAILALPAATGNLFGTSARPLFQGPVP